MCLTCIEPYTTSPERQPWMLGCGHSFCKRCVDSWNNLPASRRRCPACRAPIVGSAAKNYALASVVEAQGLELMVLLEKWGLDDTPTAPSLIIPPDSLELVEELASSAQRGASSTVWKARWNGEQVLKNRCHVYCIHDHAHAVGA